MDNKDGKYLTKRDLIQANNAAIREKRNRALREDFLDQLPEDKLFPVIFKMIHNTVNEIRVQILFDEKGTSEFLDMSRYRYDTLPSANFMEDGTVILEPSEITEAKRPYPNGREWQETVSRKPVRRQKNFRKQVLEAYGNQCAVCNINDPSLLRAAHIVPVIEDDDDTVNNGICLCILHEVAFDRNILKITPDGEVIINEGQDIKTDFSHIRLPLDKQFWPSKENLRQHFIK